MPAPAGVIREPVRNQLDGRAFRASVANQRFRGRSACGAFFRLPLSRQPHCAGRPTWLVRRAPPGISSTTSGVHPLCRAWFPWRLGVGSWRLRRGLPRFRPSPFALRPLYAGGPWSEAPRRAAGTRAERFLAASPVPAIRRVLHYTTGASVHLPHAALATPGSWRLGVRRWALEVGSWESIRSSCGASRRPSHIGPTAPRRIFQTAAVALAALRRQADMARPPRAAGDLVDDSRCAPFAAPGEAAAKLVVDDTAAAALDAGIQPDDEAIKGGCPSRAALLGGRATSALPRLGPRAEKCTSGESADDARSGWGDPEAGAQSVGRPGVPGVSGESAPPRPERLRRIFQTAAVALAALRRQADMARPPRAAGAVAQDLTAPTLPGLVSLEVGRWQLDVEARGAPVHIFSDKMLAPEKTPPSASRWPAR